MQGRRRLKQVFWAVLGAIALHLCLIWPSAAQKPDSQAVVLDGRPLFQVTSVGEVTAAERATTIEKELAELAETPNPVQIGVDVRKGVPVILINDRYLMSVTQADTTLKGRTPEEQANLWAKNLQAVLDQAQQERQKGFLLHALVYAGLALLLATLIHWLCGRLWQRTLSPVLEAITFSKQTGEARTTGVDLLLGLSLFLVRLLVWLGTVYYITNLLPVTRRLAYVATTTLGEALFGRRLTLGDRNFSILDLLVLFAVILGLVIVASAATNLLRSRVLQATGISRGAQEAVAILIKYTAIFLGAVVILQLWGIDLSSLALIASALGVGIGLGLQNIAKDFVSGLIMVFERPIQVGDFLDFGQFRGTVERIGARSTEIRTLDHVSIIVPNSRFLEQEVINWSHRNPVSRIRIPVGAAYGSNPEMVKVALLDACEHNPKILTAPAPQVFFTGFGDNALSFELLVWISQPNQQMIIKSDLYFAIEAAFKKHEIEIPFPQRDVHIRTGSLPIELPADLPSLLE